MVKKNSCFQILTVLVSRFCAHSLHIHGNCCSCYATRSFYCDYIRIIDEKKNIANVAKGLVMQCSRTLAPRLRQDTTHRKCGRDIKIVEKKLWISQLAEAGFRRRGASISVLDICILMQSIASNSYSEISFNISFLFLSIYCGENESAKLRIIC